MSHFLVTVVTNAAPTPDVIEKALAPFHEFECTGLDDEYVQNIDKTDEIKAEYAEATTSMVKMPDGEFICDYDDQFWRDATAEESAILSKAEDDREARDALPDNLKRYRAKREGLFSGPYTFRVFTLPEGAERLDKAPLSNLESFADYVTEYHGKPLVEHGEQPDLSGEHKYGYALTDDAGNIIKIVDRTNPNKRWDWYVVGGRYCGRIRIKNNLPHHNAGTVEGELGTHEAVHGRDSSRDEGVDSAQVCDIDFDGTRAAKCADRTEQWNKAAADYAQNPLGDLSFADALRKWHALVERAKAERGDSRLREVLEELDKETWSHMCGYTGFDYGIPEGVFTLEDWLAQTPSLTSYAFLLPNGQWVSNGEMGWFGMTHGEECSDNEWDKKCGELFASLKPEQYVTMVDCHI